MTEQQIVQIVGKSIDDSLKLIGDYIEKNRKYSLKMAALQVSLKSAKKNTTYEAIADATR